MCICRLSCILSIKQSMLNQRYLPYERSLWKNGSIITQIYCWYNLYTSRIYNRRRKLQFRSIFYEYKEGAMTTNKMDHGILLSFCFLKNRIGSAFVEETALDWTRNMSACIKGRHINFLFVMVRTLWRPFYVIGKTTYDRANIKKSLWPFWNEY